jgi:hypothetical protein
MIRISVLLRLSSNIVIIILCYSSFTNALSISYDNPKGDSSTNSILNFSKPINLNNNNRDSIYSQIAVSGKTMYVVWEQLVSNNGDNNSSNSDNTKHENVNYDIYMKKSTDGGRSFGKEVNVSKNSGFSEHPQIAVSGSNVYVIWDDSTPNDSYYNKEILYRKSTDGGRSFGNEIRLFDSNNGDSSNQEIAAYASNVYVVWKQQQRQQQYANNTRLYSTQNSNNNNNYTNSIFFRASTDEGSTFSKTKILSNNATELSYPKIAASSIKDVYIVWNIGVPISGNKINKGIFFTKSADNGDSFIAVQKISDKVESIGDPQITAYGNNVYVAWSGIPEFRITGDMFFTKSSDKGNNFSIPASLNTKNSLNIEMASVGNDVYVIWPGVISDQNDDIFIKSSINEGPNFTENVKNISNSIGISECPSIGLSSDGNNIYLVWEDTLAHGLHQIFFAKNTLS